jgi:hypothetical protein
MRTDPRLARLALLTRLLDQAFAVPGTRWRFGLESLLGLLPGLGDVVGALCGGYGVWCARQLGAPTSVQLRMLLNLGIDALAGAVPLLGDVFDFVFKANVRNLQLLQNWLATPHRAQRSSLFVLGAALLGLLTVLIGAMGLAIASVVWLLQHLAPSQ